MNRKTIIADRVAALLLFLAIGALFLILAPYRLDFKEQVSIFFLSPERLQWYFSDPAVLSRMVGDWLTQFYHGYGVLVSMILLLACWAGMVRLLRLCGWERPSWLLALVPVSVTGAFLVWPNYPVSALLGFSISIWAACMVSHTDKTRPVAIALGVPVLFFLVGGHALTFAIAACFVKGGRIRNSVPAAIAGTVLMIVWGLFYNLTPAQSLVFPVVANLIQPSTVVLFLLPLSVPAVLAAVRISLPEHCPGTVCAVSFLVVAAMLCTVYSNPSLEFSVKIGSLAYRSQWDKVLELSLDNTDTEYGRFYRNLAYARQGKLPDKLLECSENVGSDALFLTTGRGDSYLSMFYFADALMEVGDLSQATDCALLAQTIMPGYYSSRMLRRLAEISVTAGDYSVAMKYLDILSRSHNHGKWARNMAQCIQKDSIPEQYLIWRYRASDTDHMFVQGDIRTSLRLITAASPMNRVAVDYLLCSCLLDKQVKTFVNYYDKYWQDNLDMVLKVPELYQEALMLGVNSNESLQAAVSKYGLSDKVVSRYMQFLDFQSDHMNLAELERRFGDTYWYYVMRVSSGNTEQQK